MRVRCPRCGTAYRLPARPGSDAHATYRCARCRQVFQTEGAAEEPTLLDEAADERDDDRFAFEDEREPVAIEPEPPPAAARASPPAATAVRFARRAFLAVSLGYALLSIYLYTHPETTRAFLGGLPLIGARLAATSLNPASIQLTDVHGEYLRVQGDQLVFVVSAVAINNSPVAVSGIQVEGRSGGTREDRRVVFCGTAPHELRELSVREIALLQTLEPPKDWSLAPGEQTGCAVVFVAPPPDLHEFSLEVVVVQGRRRRAGAAGPAA